MKINRNSAADYCGSLRLLVALGLLFHVQQLWAVERRVGGDGSAAHSTIASCLDVSQAGDSCIVEPGVYDEAIVFPRAGRKSELITVRAASPFKRDEVADPAGRRAIILGGATLKEYTQVSGLEFQEKGVVLDGDGSEVIGNFIRGVGEKSLGTGIRVNRTSKPLPYYADLVIRDNYVFQVGYGLSLNCSKNCLVENNEVERLYTTPACRPAGACSGDSDYVRLHGNGFRFSGNKLHGSKLAEIDADAHVDGIQSFNNGSLGGQGRDTLTNTIIENNFIQDCHQTIWWTSVKDDYEGSPMLSFNITVRNNIFRNTWGTSARMALGGPNTDEIYVYNNLFGQSVRMTARRTLVVKNNIFIGNFMNTADDGFAWPQAAYEFSNNIVFFSGWLNKGLVKYPDLVASNVLNPDPELIFVNYAAKDYRLNATGAAVEGGANLESTGFAYDINRVHRPQGDNWDVGPYEHCAGECSGSKDTGVRPQPPQFLKTR